MRGVWYAIPTWSKREQYDDGACRLYPPQNIAIGTDGDFATLFPSVNVEDWCLSWTPKDVEP